MPGNERMPISVYSILRPHFQDSTFEEISAEILLKINGKRKDGFWTEESNTTQQSGFNIKVFSSFKQVQPKWGKFINPILSPNSLLQKCKNSTHSFICLIEHNERIYAIAGGNGSFAIEDFTSPSFGLDILTRLISKESQVIKSIQERGVTGIILGETRHYRGDQKLSDEDQFGKIYKELSAELNQVILTKTLKFSKHDIKKGKQHVWQRLHLK